jgi:hypothetical protein
MSNLEAAGFPSFWAKFQRDAIAAIGEAMVFGVLPYSSFLAPVSRQSRV